MRLTLVLLATLLCLGAVPARAAPPPVDVALVLVTDVSRSIDDGEYDLEKHGYAAAFTDQRVINAVTGGMIGAIAVSYVEFAGEGQVKTVLDWTTIHDTASARGFADRLLAAPRSFWGRTAISGGIDHAMQMFAEAPITPSHRMIDVCGDGTNNAGRDITAARDDAVAGGVTINGLAIINERPVYWAFQHVQPPGGLDNYYRQNVTGGPGSFVLVVRDFQSFQEAMTRKLVSEIASVRTGRVKRS